MSWTEESISIAIAAFNEEATLEAAVREALEVLSQLTPDYEVLIVDDGSRDATAQIADRLALEDKHIRVIHHPRNLGFTGAIRSCFENARGDLVLLAPADRQVALNELTKFVDLIGDCDIVTGYFIKRMDPFYRSVYSWGYHRLCRLLLGVKQRQISTLNLWRRPVLDKITIESHPADAVALPEMFAKATRMGCRIKDVGINHSPRFAGEAKGASPMVIIRTFLGLFGLRRRLKAPLK